MQHFACGVVSCLAIFAGESSVNLPFDLGTGSEPGAPIPLSADGFHYPSPKSIVRGGIPPIPSQFFPNTGVSLDSVKSLPSLLSQSSSSSFSSVPPPHRRQDRGIISPPTSSTPSSTLGDANSWKDNSSPYSRHQRATPRNWEQWLRMESQWMFQTLVKEYGMQVAQGAFEQVVRDLGVEMNHDVLGCRDCHWEGRDIIYCRRPRRNQEHAYHECPVGQECC